MKKFLLRRDVIWISLATFFILAGGLGYAIAERTSFFSALYWAITEATTAGGSYSPATHPGRVVNVVLLLTAAPALAAVFGVMTAQHTARKVHERNQTHFEAMETSNKAHMEAMEKRLKKHITETVGSNDAVSE